jgi:hypothetical protein
VIDRSGRRLRFHADEFERLLRSAKRLEAAERFYVRVLRTPGCAGFVGRVHGTRRSRIRVAAGDVARSRASGVDVRDHVGNGTPLAPFAASVDRVMAAAASGSPECEELALAIAEASEEIETLQDDLGALFIEALASGLRVSTDALGYDWSSVPFWLAIRIEVLQAEIASAHTRRSVLAAMWESHDCWSWAAPRGGGGGSGGGGQCRNEWSVVEISCDGGVTWEVWWEGWVTICDDPQ